MSSYNGCDDIRIDIPARHDLLAEIRESATSSASKEEVVADFEGQAERWQADFERYLKPWIQDSTVVLAEVKNDTPPAADTSEDSSSGRCLEGHVSLSLS